MFAKPMPRICAAAVTGKCLDSIGQRKTIDSTNFVDISSKNDIDSLRLHQDIDDCDKGATNNKKDMANLNLAKGNTEKAVDTKSLSSPSISSLVASQISSSSLELQSAVGLEMPENIIDVENDDCEIVRCKELMTLQLSLISRQQDLLKLRDKEILQLKAENHSLKCRLERMERRISLSKKRKDSVDLTDLPSFGKRSRKEIDPGKNFEPDSVHLALSNSPVRKIKADIVSDNAVTVADAVVTSSCSVQSSPVEKTTPVKEEHDYVNMGKDMKNDCVPVPVSFIDRCKNQLLSCIASSPLVTIKKGDVTSPSTSNTVTVGSNVTFKICDQCPHCIAMVTEVANLLSVVNNTAYHPGAPRYSVIDTKPSDDALSKLANIDTTVSVDSSVTELRTHCPYFKQPLCFMNFLSTEETVSSEDGASATLNIPTWRINSIEPENSTDLVNTEKTDDESYLQRHTKYETAEKRRKRWDIQRIREYRYNQKLRQKILKQERQDETMETFLPSVYDVKSVEIEKTQI